MINNGQKARRLKKLKADISGHLQDAATYCTVHVSTISRVLDGKITNDELVGKIILFRNELSSKKEAIYSQI
jgi:hypothetical protein